MRSSYTSKIEPFVYGYGSHSPFPTSVDIYKRENEEEKRQRLARHEREAEELRKRQREREEGARQRQREREEEEARQRQARRQRQREREAEEARQREREEEVRQRRARQREREEARRVCEIANAWKSYETRWSELNQSWSQQQVGGSASLTFEKIPWPVAVSVADSSLDGPRTRKALEEHLLRPQAIREFILSPAHSSGVSSKDRIRAALLRWHPDKLVRMLGMIVESDMDAVTDGVAIVVRCLNEMLERENEALDAAGGGTSEPR